MRALKRRPIPLSALKRKPVSITTQKVDEILVISATGAMTKMGGVDELLAATDEAMQLHRGKILLELAPTYWDSGGLQVIDKALGLLATHQEKVICKLGPCVLIGRGIIETILARGDIFDRRDEAVEYLKEDC